MLLIYEAHYLDMADALTYESCVRGYHYYQDIWEPVNGEQLECRHNSIFRGIFTDISFFLGSELHIGTPFLQLFRRLTYFLIRFTDVRGRNYSR